MQIDIHPIGWFKPPHLRTEETPIVQNFNDLLALFRLCYGKDTPYENLPFIDFQEKTVLAIKGHEGVLGIDKVKLIAEYCLNVIRLTQKEAVNDRFFLISIPKQIIQTITISDEVFHKESFSFRLYPESQKLIGNLFVFGIEINEGFDHDSFNSPLFLLNTTINQVHESAPDVKSFEKQTKIFTLIQKKDWYTALTQQQKDTAAKYISIQLTLLKMASFIPQAIHRFLTDLPGRELQIN